ncbi:MAG: glutamate racemase [Micavibrio sp.]|nr:MAG: glutamate racemase [Micavibrio sp.]
MMRIGFFDSGLGGLMILKAARQMLPRHDFVYFGDTLHLPYGGRSNDAIYDYTQAAAEYLFRSEDCALIIVACNTASAAALRRLQQGWLAEHFPERRILGVVIPTLEVTIEKNCRRPGLLATERLVQSQIYQIELQKLNPEIQIFAAAAPLLVPLIENDGGRWLPEVLKHYLSPLLAENIDSLILGCTHYPFLRPYLREFLPEGFPVLSQDEIIPGKLADYLARHPEIDEKISRNGLTKYLVTDITSNYTKTAAEIYGASLDLEKVVL